MVDATVLVYVLAWKVQDPFNRVMIGPDCGSSEQKVEIEKYQCPEYCIIFANGWYYMHAWRLSERQNRRLISCSFLSGCFWQNDTSNQIFEYVISTE